MRNSAKIVLLFLLLAVTNYQGELFARNTTDDKDKKRKEVSDRKVKDADFDSNYFFQKSDGTDPEIQKLRAKAANSVNEIDAEQRYVEFLAPSDLNRLPIGLKKKVGNTTIKIAVTNAVFTSRYAELTVYAKIDIPQNNTSNAPWEKVRKLILQGSKIVAENEINSLKSEIKNLKDRQKKLDSTN